MNREEAQFILGAYRANSEDAHDPMFQEPLALARQDPDLGRWFAEQQALDRSFAAKLKSTPVPATLRAQLLLVRSTAASKPRWHLPGWLAVAACIALLITFGGPLFRRGGQPREFVQFRQAMTRASLDMANHYDIGGLDTAGYRAWLTEHQMSPDFILPPGLAEKGIAACKIIEWQQHKVTMLCFKLSDQHVDIFVVNASDLPGLSLGATPSFAVDQEVTSAAWQSDGKIYLLAGTMPKSDLQALL